MPQRKSFESGQNKILIFFNCLINGIKTIDDLDLGLETQAGDSPAFVRAQLSEREFRHIDKTGKPYPDSQSIMLAITKEKNRYLYNQIPGIHDVTTFVKEKEDPFELFASIIENGFHGGPYMNVALFGRDYLSGMHYFEYRPKENHEKRTQSSIDLIKGDRFRLALWTGFTRNHSGTNASEKNYGYGTVGHAPAESIDSFIIIDTSKGDVAKRIEFYSRNLERVRNGQTVFLDGNNNHKPIDIRAYK